MHFQNNIPLKLRLRALRETIRNEVIIFQFQCSLLVSVIVDVAFEHFNDQGAKYQEQHLMIMFLCFPKMKCYERYQFDLMIACNYAMNIVILMLCIDTLDLM